ncbi:hypothetical protein MMC24_000627 [Lignoscripta atroalba]|nr:hypothetical protein [Lignoscripta atroalba]
MHTLVTPVQITFGVELEFLVAFNRAEYAPKVPAGEALHLWDPKYSPSLSYNEKLRRFVRLDIIHELRKHGFLVNDYHTPGHHKWTVSSDGSVEPTQSELKPQITGDPREEKWPISCGALGYADIEVKSRVMVISMDALVEVYSAIEVINSRFPTIVNDSTGLHVHVGNLDLGFPLQTVKNLITFVAVFEKQLNQLHPENRLTNDYCAQPSKSFSPGERTPLGIAQRVHSMTSIEELVQLMGSEEDGTIDHNKCYNVNNLQYGLQGKRTIEFRQHEGILDPLGVIKWIELTCALVGAAHHSDGKTFLGLVLEHSDNANLTIIDLLNGMNLVNLANHYQGRIHMHPVEELEEGEIKED